LRARADIDVLNVILLSQDDAPGDEETMRYEGEDQ